MNAPLERLQKRAGSILGRNLTRTQTAQLYNYLNLLIKWQKIHRLAGSDDPEWLVTHLILDSLLFVHALPGSAAWNGNTLLDFGSGAGVPGVPLAVVFPEARVTLLESRQKRASFLAEVVRSLPLGNAKVIPERAEAVIDSLAGAFDVVVMRCAGDPATVVPKAKQFVAEGGVVIVSGPPKLRPAAEGEWVEVQGLGQKSSRRFLRIECQRLS